MSIFIFARIMSWNFLYFCFMLFVTCSCSTQTWRSCVEEARRLNRTFVYAGLTSEGMDTPEVPRLDISGIGLHPIVKRFVYPIMQEYEGPGQPMEEVADLSLCRWQYQVDNNDTRIPRKLYKAVCYHDNGDNRCDLSFLNNSTNLLLDLFRHRTECAVVHTSVEVAYECCNNGEYSLRKEWVDWSVGCVCAKRKFRIVNAIQGN